MHAQIQHPNVIPLLGIWGDSSDGPPLMIMPFAENGAALAYLQGDNCDTSDCANIVSCSPSCRDCVTEIISLQLTGSALGLSHLHSRSPVVVHGDVKPVRMIPLGLYSRLLTDLLRGIFSLTEEATLLYVTSVLAGFATKSRERILKYARVDTLDFLPRSFLTTRRNFSQRRRATFTALL